MELWDLYTYDRQLTGRIMTRGEEMPENCYHLVVHVWIKNSDEKYIISRRSADRPTYPLMYECVGGSVVSGEDSLHGAIREAKEEIGVRLNEKDGRLVFSEVRKSGNGEKYCDILDVWLFEYDGDIMLSDADTDEVSEAVWLAPEEIKQLIYNKKMVQLLSYFDEKINYMKLL